MLGQDVLLVSSGVRGSGGFGIVHEAVWLAQVCAGLGQCRRHSALQALYSVRALLARCVLHSGWQAGLKVVTALGDTPTNPLRAMPLVCERSASRVRSSASPPRWRPSGEPPGPAGLFI